MWKSRALALAVFWAMAAGVSAAAQSSDIMAEWASVKSPAPPALVPVAVDPAKTALLVISFDKKVCSAADRVRCPAAVPKVKALLDQARAHHMLVVHSYTKAQMTAGMAPELTPLPGEPVVQAAADKFLNSGLDKMLRDKGVSTVILTGTAGNGAVLFTAVGGATLGFDLIVPVDTMPADSAYHEQFAIVEMADIGFLHARTKLTRSDLIAFPGEPARAAGPIAPSGIMQEWAGTRPPAAPKLSPVAVDPAKTALLVMDFNKNSCTPADRARCAAAVPNVKKLLDAARAKHMLVVQVITPNMKPSDVVEALAPAPGEPVLQVQGDKFYRSDLEKMLKDKGITTVIATGTAGNGAVLLTTIGGVSRGFNVVVPIDTMPAATAYHEQFAIFEIADVNFLHAHSTLTKSDMITF